MKKTFILSTITSTLLLSSLAFTPQVFATEYDEQIQQNLNKIQESENKVHTLEETIESLQAEVQNTEDQLKTINGDITSNENRIEEVVQRLEDAQTEMTVLQEEIAVLEDNIAKRTEQLENQARTVQVDGQTTNYIEFIIEAESLTDIIGRIDIVTSLVQSNRKLVQAQLSDKEAVVEKTERTEQTIVQQNALAGELELISEDLEQQRLEKEVLVAQLAFERASAESDRERFLAQKASAEQAVTELVVAREEAIQAVRAAEEQRRAEESAAAERAAQEAELAAAEEAQEVSTASSQREIVEETAVTQSETETSAPEASSNRSTETSASSTESSTANNSSSQSNSGNSNNSNSSNAGSGSQTSTPAVSQPAATPAPKPKPKPAPAPAPSGTSWRALSGTANSLLGTPYFFTGTTPSGFDCSGFTSYVFRKAGITLPRSAAAQYAGSKKVSNPRPGDLVFFSQGSGVSHVGIYVGGGQFIGSQSSTGVAYASLNTGYWASRVVGYGRY